MGDDRREPVDYFWSFRSHYCYLSIERVRALEDRYPVRIKLRTVYPIAIRMPEFFSNPATKNPNRWKYVMRDAERTAERLGLPFAWPHPDPIIMDMKTLHISEEQPYIYRLSRLGIAAARLDRGLEFAAAVAGLIFGGTRDWDQANVMKDAVAEIGLDLDALDREIEADPGDYDREIHENQAALDAAGHWGVPTLAFRGEPFFGQDRIEDFCWRLEQSGISPR